MCYVNATNNSRRENENRTRNGKIMNKSYNLCLYIFGEYFRKVQLTDYNFEGVKTLSIWVGYKISLFLLDCVSVSTPALTLPPSLQQIFLTPPVRSILETFNPA